MCLQTVRDSGAQCVKSLFRNKKELCSIGLELPNRDTTRLTEVCFVEMYKSSATCKQKIQSYSSSTVLFQIHFVCLPGQCEGDEVTQQVRFLIANMSYSKAQK